ncbi:hypothetical protein MMC07_009633 [Pseudocyphellaria aurata]|nr:hypothetical protein [Pseudocyphellaria aurata]
MSPSAESTTQHATRLDFTTFRNVIDGKLTTTAGTRQSVNPATGEPNPPVPLSTRQDLDDAVAAARKAQRVWAKTSFEERRTKLQAYLDAFETYRDDFVKLLIKEQGKAYKLAHDEIDRTVAMIRATSKLELVEEIVEDDGKRSATLRYVPIGVTCGLVPWNYPLLLAWGKIAPAVYAGNSIIIKPSPDTPYGGLKLVELAMQFFPPGVIQVLSGGHDLGPMCTAHPGIDKISFTGSSATGRLVMESCSKTLKRVTLELGGNDAAIICEDVDIAETVPKVATLCFLNSGQICMAIKRVYVHESIYRRFLDALVAYSKTFKVGPGTEQDTFMGPVQNAAQYKKVQTYFDDIGKEGQKVALGGGVWDKSKGGAGGFFFNPTLIDNPPENSRLVRDEPFGPIVPLLQWANDDEVLARANDTNMGLGASVWSPDVARAERMARQLEAGNVWVNNHFELKAHVPYGGHKWSGIGTEWGLAGLKQWCNSQTVWLPSKKATASL